MSTLDIKGDARRHFEVLQSGGIAVIPNDAGYALMGGSAQAEAKKTFALQGAEAIGNTRAEFAGMVKQRAERMGALAKRFPIE
jgi:hypothetical protein